MADVGKTAPRGTIPVRQTGEISEGVAVPVSITDLGGGRFEIAGDGFEADINKI